MKRLSLRVIVTFALCFIGLVPSSANAETGFDQWLQSLRAEARAEGISQTTLDSALLGVEFLPDVIDLDRRQPEHTITFEQYVRNIVSDSRVRKGREMYAQHRALLEKIAAQYGVPAKYIVALWGIETFYGRNAGNSDVISSLATLAYEGRRHEFFKRELINALKIIQQGHISASLMEGSWAGAMGQCQFMPSSFLKFAADGNGDGKRDIWNSLPDVFASAANYLAMNGWKGDESWGREVRMPAGHNGEAWVGLTVQRPLSEWVRLGVKRADGSPLPNNDLVSASLVQPDGPGGASYLVYNNFRVIMKWNRSTYFATSVGLLADRIGM